MWNRKNRFNEIENEHDESRLNMFNQYNYSNEEEENNNEEEIKSLKRTFNSAGFHSISQTMYSCRKCKVDICQSCAILCHKDHPLKYEGFKSNLSCHCFEKIDSHCTFRK